MNQVVKNQQFRQMYPAIYEIVISMGSSNGMFHREADQDAVVAAAVSAFEADGVDTADVQRLDKWIATLSAEQKDVLSDGEETEREQLIFTGPFAGDQPAASLLDDAYDAMTEVF